MRLPESEIKSALLHPDRIVRDVALYYFAGSFSKDPTIIPLVIQAIETYGWEHAFIFYYRPASLVQTEATLPWVLEQLDLLAEPKDGREKNRRRHLSEWVAWADVALLTKFAPAIAASKGLTDEARQALTHRLELAVAAPDDCWKRLVDFCEGNKAQQYIDMVDLPHADRLIEAIGRTDACADRILAVLSQRLDEYIRTAAGWLEPFAARIAGHMRLRAAVPLLVTKLLDDCNDMMNDACAEAFIRIGTDGMAEAICERFLKAEWHYRLYASGCLDNIHSDLVVSRCFELLEQEKDFTIRENLLCAIFGNFCPDGIEPARQIVLKGSREVPHQLVGLATLTGVNFPELESWRKKEEQQDAELDARWGGKTKEDLIAEMGREDDELDDDELEPLPDFPIEPPAPIVRGEKIGRNDPCPCGSGKKYKKCCLGKD